MIGTVCLITNMPAPYRVPVFDRLSLLLKELHIQLLVLYLSKTEPNRSWAFPNMAHDHVVLAGKTYSFGKTFFHWNLSSLLKELRRSKPIAVITSGFDASMLQAFLWARIAKVPHISFSDGTLDSERRFGFFRRLTRRAVVKGSHCVIGASMKTLALYRHYGAPSEKCFESCLCVDNDRYQGRDQKKEFDLLYVSQIIHGKMPDLIIEIMVELGTNYSLLVVGDGTLKTWFLKELEEKGVRYRYAGFVQPDETPAFFQKVRLLLFPTRRDAWGIVANEACAAGIPVLTTREAGVAGELIIDGENGFVLPPVASGWAEHIRTLLNDRKLYSDMCREASSRVRMFTCERAARGIVDAVTASLDEQARKR